MRVYLDNCSYNRPYDDQTQIRIHLETEAKLHIQEMIKDNRLKLGHPMCSIMKILRIDFCISGKLFQSL